MNIDKFDDEANSIQKLTKKGTEILTALKGYIKGEFSEHLIINESESTSTCLPITFYGLRLLFRIEMNWNSSNLIGSIAAVGISDVEPKETWILAVQFDVLGNIEQRLTPNEFSAPFIASVFSKIQSAGTVLKP